MPGFFRDLVETFREESVVALRALEQYSECGDFTGMRKSAHVLASMSAGIGAVRVCALAQILERAAAANIANPAALSQLRSEHQCALCSLQDSLGDGR